MREVPSHRADVGALRTVDFSRNVHHRVSVDGADLDRTDVKPRDVDGGGLQFDRRPRATA